MSEDVLMRMAATCVAIGCALALPCFLVFVKQDDPRWLIGPVALMFLAMTLIMFAIAFT